MQYEVAIVGSGGAGSSLLLALDREVTRRGVRPPSIVVLDPVHRSTDDRTWCFWDEGANPLEACIHRAWHQVGVQTAQGRRLRLDLGGGRYVMIRSSAVYAAADAAAERLGAVRIAAPVRVIEQDGDGAHLLGQGPPIRARWVFDSRPGLPSRPARTAWWQHFRGWNVRFEVATLDPQLPMLMDLSVPQTTRAVNFGYLLPTDEYTGLVEYTVFSRDRWDDDRSDGDRSDGDRSDGDRYDDQLRAYLDGRWPGRGYRIESVENGAIPMTDARYPRRVGRRVMRLGTAGGSTRPATGYTFATLQRQSATVARLLLDGREPLPPKPYRSRHSWMDSVLLRALDRGLVEGAEVFSALLEGNPSPRVVAFLDGRSGLADDIALMRSLPFAPMLRAALTGYRSR